MNTITNLNTFPIGNSLDGINTITEEINTLSLLVDGTNNMIADLNMDNHVIKNLDVGVDANDAVNVSQLSDLRSYTDASLNLRVLKSGDEMTGLLRVPQVRLIGQTTTFNNNSTFPVDVANRTNTYLVFEPAGSVDDWAYLRQIGGSNNIHLALDFHDDAGDGKFSLRSINSISNPDATPNTFFYSSPSGTNINNLLTLNYNTASLDIRATEETQDSILYLSTPYQNGATNRRKTAIIADGIGNWNRANLHFCLNQALTHNDVTIADSRMCIINLTGNVGIATTTPSERLDVNGNAKLRGYLDMSLNKVINIANPTNAQDGATKNYVDSSISNLNINNYLLRDGSLPMTGQLNMNSNKIVNVSDPTSAQDGATKNYVDTGTPNPNYVKKAGDTMTGNLNIQENLTVSKKINGSHIQLASGATVNSQGCWIDWNYNVGDGRTNILNQKGGGSGGIAFGEVSQTNSRTYNMLLDGSGKLGIGTTAPSEKLDVSGNSIIRGSLNMNTTNKIINLANGSNNLDAVNFSQLTDLRTYTDASLNLKVNKAGDTMTNYLQLPEIRLTGQTTSFNSHTIDSSNRTNTYAVFEPAGSNNDWVFLRQIGGDNDFHLSLDFHDDDNDGKFSLRNIVSTANPDTVKPFFTSNPGGTSIFNPNSTTNIQKQLNLETNSNGIWINPYFSAGAWNPLVSNESKGIIFSKGSVDTGDLVIGPWSNNPNGIKINSNGEVFMNNNASTSNSSLTYSSSAILFINSSETLYNYYTMTISSNLQVFLPSTGSSDATMTNKLIYISIPNATTIKLLASGSFSNTINVNGTSASEFTFTPTYRQISILGSSTIGSYTINTSSNNKIPLSLDQLTIKSNLDTNNNSEFTGIRFLNTSTDAGYIRCETDREHNNSVMRFYSRSSNNIILPLEISNVITSHRPIIRKAFSDGELIKSKCYGGSGLNKTVSVGNGWVEIVSLTFNADESVGLDVCCFVINFNTSYYINGSAGDDAYSKVSDTTGTEQILQINRQRYTDANGGGTRSGTIFPVMTRYTPTQSLTNKTRTIKIYAKLTTDGITGDNLYISNNDNESANNWYAEIRQIYSP